MARRHAPLLFCLVATAGVAVAAPAADALVAPPARLVDAVKARATAKELEKQRLIAKLHADAPRLVESHGAMNPLEAPIFHRYDRP